MARFAQLLAASAVLPRPAMAEMLDVEKPDLALSFIKLIGMAPLAIAYEQHFFEDVSLYITLAPQANWKVPLNQVILGELDRAQMRPWARSTPRKATTGSWTPQKASTSPKSICKPPACWSKKAMQRKPFSPRLRPVSNLSRQNSSMPSHR